MALSQEEQENIKEIHKFSEEARRPISSREFRKAKEKINELKEKISRPEQNKNFHYYYYLLRELGWIREELEGTQRNKVKFETEAEEFITSFNKLIIAIILKVLQTKQLEQIQEESLIAEADKIMDPIFLHVEKEKPGYASFTEIIFDRDYYHNFYKKMFSDLEKNYPKMKNEVTKFREWKKMKNEKLKEMWGMKK